MSLDSTQADEVLLSLVVDDSLLALDPDDWSCVLHDYHSPLPWVLHRHHVVPISWTRALGRPSSRVVPVCATGHEALHSAIRSAVQGRPMRRMVDEKVQPYLEEAMAYWYEHMDQLARLPGVDIIRRYPGEASSAPLRTRQPWYRRLLGGGR